MLRLLLLGIVIAGLIWAFCWVIGIDKLEEDYLKDYEELYDLIYHGDLTTDNFNLIMDKMINLRRYKCANKEKIDVFETEFKRRFLNL